MFRQRWFSGLSAGLLCMGAALSVRGVEEANSSGVWPQWRGSQRNGVVTGAAWPENLDSAGLQLMWRQEIGEGYPGPVVSTNRVFTVETRAKKQEVVRAFDRISGRQLWETSWEGAMKVPFFSAKNGSWVRSTPAYDGESLYVAGMCDVLVCINAANGQIRWKIDFAERNGTPVPSFGFVCSPLVVEGFVYVQAGGGFVKLDKQNGSTLWQTLQDGGGMYGSAFSSPVYARLCGVDQLIVQTRSLLAGVDVTSGVVLWKQAVQAFRGMNIQTPVVWGDTLFTSCYGGASLLYAVQKSNDVFSVSEVWRDKKSQGYMSSPVVINDHLYFHRRDQRFSCLNLKTKEILWRSPAYGQYCSLAANRNKILALNQKGELLLIEAAPEEFKLMDRRKIADQDTWGHIAVAGDQLFIRELKAISAYRWHGKE